MATKDLSTSLVLGASVVVIGHFGFGQTVSQKAEIKLTGIVLAADHRPAIRRGARSPFDEVSRQIARLGADYLVFRGGKTTVGPLLLGSDELRDLRRRQRGRAWLIVRNNRLRWWRNTHTGWRRRSVVRAVHDAAQARSSGFGTFASH